MTTKEYALKEFERLGVDYNDTFGIVYENILELCDVFDKQGHSGSSATYVINTLSRLLSKIPLEPLTGEADEWDTSRMPYQNKRCSFVFKDNETGKAYNSMAKIFSNDGENWFLSADSREYITFPYSVPFSPEKVLL